MIEVENLKKRFEHHQVLSGISIKAEKSRVLTVIGGSGTGKSTFLKCVIRLIEPDEGTIKIDGHDVTHIHDEYKLFELRKNFGYLFQEGALFDSMPVWGNVTFGLKYLTNIAKSKYRQIAREKLALVGLKDVEDLMPSELSGGMKKRVALARSIASEPRCILYDEPTSGLDPIMSDIINDLILDLNKKLNVTSIVITHDIKSAYKISDKIAFLHGGKFVMVGTPKEFKNSTNPYVKQFIDGSSRGPIKMKIKEFELV
jgi:phospholipid/cholesterol/gamma-HCH transport system ATP-binding protein